MALYSTLHTFHRSLAHTLQCTVLNAIHSTCVKSKCLSCLQCHTLRIKNLNQIGKFTEHGWYLPVCNIQSLDKWVWNEPDLKRKTAKQKPKEKRSLVNINLQQPHLPFIQSIESSIGNCCPLGYNLINEVGYNRRQKFIYIFCRLNWKWFWYAGVGQLGSSLKGALSAGNLLLDLQEIALFSFYWHKIAVFILHRHSLKYLLTITANIAVLFLVLLSLKVNIFDFLSIVVVVVVETIFALLSQSTKFSTAWIG